MTMSERTSSDWFHSALIPNDATIEVIAPGISLRDYFAGQALSGGLASTSASDAIMLDKLAKYSFAVADAMLAARGEA